MPDGFAKTQRILILEPENYQPGRALPVQDAPHYHRCLTSRRAQFVKRGPCPGSKPLVGHRAAEAVGRRRKFCPHRVRQSQRSGLQGLAQHLQGFPLLLRVNHTRRGLPVALDRIDILHPAHHLGHPLQRKPVVVVNRRQPFFQQPQRFALIYRRLAEGIQQHPPHLHRILQIEQRVGLIVPELRTRVRTRNRPRVAVGQKQHPPPQPVGHKFLQPGFFLTGGEHRVPVGNRKRIVVARPGTVGIGEVHPSVGQLNERSRVVHHRSAPVSAGGKIMRQPQRVAHFVSGQLPRPRQHELVRCGIGIKLGNP